MAEWDFTRSIIGERYDANGAMSQGGWGGFGNATTSSGVDWTGLLRTGIGAVSNVWAAANAMKAQRHTAAAQSAGILPPWAISAGGAALGAGASAIGSWLGGGGTPSMSVINPSTPGIFAGGPMDIFRPGEYFRAGSQGVRPNPLLLVQNPVSGRLVAWRYVGGPVEFRGDRRIAREYQRRHGSGRRGATKRRR